MRIYLSFLFAVFSAVAVASDSLPDVAETENQFTQATLDAHVIDKTCAQTINDSKSYDRKNCYQRAATYVAQCREQLKQQEFARGVDNSWADREQKVTELKACVQQADLNAVGR